MRTVECVVIGGGPAGLAAAVAAADVGVQVLLVDENSQLGGQYYRQLASGFRLVDPARQSHEALDGQALIAETVKRGVTVALNTTVWGIFEGRTVGLATEAKHDLVRAQTLILAPGAYDRPVPFPGWTTPGVITAGGAQNLMKAYRVLPGRRVLVAGSGPLLLVVASTLAEAGAEVVAVCEAAPMTGLWRYGPRMLAHLNFVQQGYDYWRRLRDAWVPIRPGWIIRRAVGTDVVHQATVAQCDGGWHPISGTERTFDVDTVVVGYGFLPSIELSRLAGVDHVYRPDMRAWLPTRSEELETTIPNVFAIGDGAGVAGSAVAQAEGALAGLVVANRLGKAAGRAYRLARARTLGRLKHLAGFRRLMDRIYQVGPGLYTLSDDETIACRCEEVTFREVRAAMEAGAATPGEVKAWTRCGMGRCQGRMCGAALTESIARRTGRRREEIGSYTQRPPVKPVPFGALASDGLLE